MSTEREPLHSSWVYSLKLEPTDQGNKRLVQRDRAMEFGVLERVETEIDDQHPGIYRVRLYEARTFNYDTIPSLDEAKTRNPHSMTLLISETNQRHRAMITSRFGYPHSADVVLELVSGDDGTEDPVVDFMDWAEVYKDQHLTRLHVGRAAVFSCNVDAPISPERGDEIFRGIVARAGYPSAEVMTEK